MGIEERVWVNSGRSNCNRTRSQRIDLTVRIVILLTLIVSMVSKLICFVFVVYIASTIER